MLCKQKSADSREFGDSCPCGFLPLSCHAEHLDPEVTAVKEDTIPSA